MMNIPQVKRVAERPTSETTLSDKVVNVQYKLLKAQSKTRVAMSENKLLLQKIAELRRDWREDVRDRQEVLSAIHCFANACCI